MSDSFPETSISRDLAIEGRSAVTPGSFSINSNGILVFPTVEDFHQTVDYIVSDSNLTQLGTFPASLGVFILNKKAQMVMDSITSESYSWSTTTAKWPDFDDYLEMMIDSGDTAITFRYGTWGEFLNLDNLVIIDTVLYKITREKTIMILDGDIGKLDDAEILEQSDTSNGVFVTPRACSPCDPTGKEWKFSRTTEVTYNTKRYRMESSQIFSNMTTAQFLGNGLVRVTPHFVVTTDNKIQKKGLVWFCHRMHFNWNRQVWVTHNLQLPASCPNCSTANLWFESSGWDNHYECKFDWDRDYKYNPYFTQRTWDMPSGYCLAVRIFAQSFTTTIDQPVMENAWYFYPYPLIDFSGYVENHCPNFNWLYQL